jgi:hypothetical protein
MSPCCFHVYSFSHIYRFFFRIDSMYRIDSIWKPEVDLLGSVTVCVGFGGAGLYAALLKWSQGLMVSSSHASSAVESAAASWPDEQPFACAGATYSVVKQAVSLTPSPSFDSSPPPFYCSNPLSTSCSSALPSIGWWLLRRVSFLRLLHGESLRRGAPPLPGLAGPPPPPPPPGRSPFPGRLRDAWRSRETHRRRLGDGLRGSGLGRMREQVMG